MIINEERKQLINKLNSMGVSCIYSGNGQSPYTMPIDELKTLCDWIEKREDKKVTI